MPDRPDTRHVPHHRPSRPSGSWPAYSARRRSFEKEFGKRAPLFRPPAMFSLYEDIREDPEPVLGQYPRGFLATIMPWLNCQRHEVLHVCSGSLPRGEGVRVDLRPEARPDVIADGRCLPFRDGSFSAVLIDPPYATEHAESLYGVAYPRPSHLLREAARVTRHGGRIGFVHYITPNPPEGARVIKVFGLSVGFGFPMRAVVIYEREQGGLF